MYLTNLNFSKFIPRFVQQKTGIGTISIDRFVQFSSRQTKPKSRVLDAGAGSCPYKKYFLHTIYESTDFKNIFDKQSKNIHDFTCSLDSIPKSNGSYDAIICTEVLEHLEYPQKAINEFYRILKKGGKLFLTTPQSWGLHGEPYHYFNFTKYGLKSLFTNAGFNIIFIRPLGGIFWYLGFVIKNLPDYLFSQYIKGNHHSFSFYLLFLLYISSLPFCVYLIPLIFYYLDKIDKKRGFTLGYACYCLKPTRNK